MFFPFFPKTQVGLAGKITGIHEAFFRELTEAEKAFDEATIRLEELAVGPGLIGSSTIPGLNNVSKERFQRYQKVIGVKMIKMCKVVKLLIWWADTFRVHMLVELILAHLMFLLRNHGKITSNMTI